MNIRIAQNGDRAFLYQHDGHIQPDELDLSIRLGRVLIAEQGGQQIGWLRWNLFWDNTPFLNMLYLLEEHRNKGYGQRLLLDWEERMKAQEYPLVMTSTLASEQAQHFYRKLNYEDAGALLLKNQPLEILFTKDL